MNIFFWILIIAVVTLVLNMLFILRMKKQNRIRLFPICMILAAGYLSAGMLYLCTYLHGTQILSKTPAASFEIETESYQTASNGTQTSFAFCSKEGIPFHFSEEELVDPSFPENPGIVEVYYCKTRIGFTVCFLSEGDGVYYQLK